MKIAIMLVVVLVLGLLSSTGLLLGWMVSTPIVTNYINRPAGGSPFFGSLRLVDRFTYTPGFSFRELFTFDRLALGLVFLITLLKTAKKPRVLYSRVDWPFIIFFLAIMLSSFWSRNRILAIKVAFDTFGLCYMAYFIGKNAIDTELTLKRILNAVVVLAAAMAVISIIEWRLFGVGHPLYRVTGPFLYWENLGLTVGIGFFITIQRRIMSRSPLDGTRPRRALLGLLLLLLLVMFMSIGLAQTRSIYVAVLLGLVLISITAADFIPKMTVRGYYSIVVLMVAVVVVSPGLLTNTPFYQSRLTSRTDADRVESYRAALRMFRAHPVNGVGLKDFSVEKPHYVSFFEVSYGTGGYCHNSFLVVAAETGVMGLLPLFALLFGCIGVCFRYYRAAKRSGSREDILLAAAFSCITLLYWLLAMTFDPFFETTVDNKVYYLLLGIAVRRYTLLVQRVKAPDLIPAPAVTGASAILPSS